jgi:hypothetical protein
MQIENTIYDMHNFIKGNLEDVVIQYLKIFQ